MMKRITGVALTLMLLTFAAAAETAAPAPSVRLAQAQFDAATSEVQLAEAAQKTATDKAAAQARVDEAKIAQLNAQTALNKAKLASPAPAEVRADVKPAEPKPLLAYLEPSKDSDQKYWLTVAARTNALATRPIGYSAQARIEPSDEKSFHDAHKNDSVAYLHETAERSFATANSRFKDIPWQQHLSGLTAKNPNRTMAEQAGNGVASTITKGGNATRTVVGAASGIFTKRF